MKPLEVKEEIREKVRGIKSQGDHMPPRGDIQQIAEQVISSLRGDITVGHMQIYEELAKMAEFISRARAEIAHVKPNEIPNTHIPNATDQLEAVVGATESATGVILDACEMITELKPQLPQESQAQLEKCVTSIYEACNFQDVTGQRISKVVKTLQLIDERVKLLLKSFGDVEDVSSESDTKNNPSGPKKPTETELLYGPQMPEEAKRQAEIDAILASFD